MNPCLPDIPAQTWGLLVTAESSLEGNIYARQYTGTGEDADARPPCQH